jgi:hypothetical protein
MPVIYFTLGWLFAMADAPLSLLVISVLAIEIAVASDAAALARRVNAVRTSARATVRAARPELL